MEQQISKPERKNMDACLRRLKQELVSMKEAGDGLQNQMNSMMGALQELKLLQVQTALESLHISGWPINRGPPLTPSAPPITPSAAPPAHGDPRDAGPNHTLPEDLSPTPSHRPSLGGRVCIASKGPPGSRARPKRSSLGSSSTSISTSSSTSSLESASSEGPQSPGSSQRNGQDAAPRGWAGYTAPQVSFCGPAVGSPPPEPGPHHAAPRRSQVLDLPSILYSLSREGPSLDSQRSQDSVEDSSDWTSSLMSQRRNRQPLVLGDNVFADLVGNWLALPELGQGEEGEDRRRWDGERVADSPTHPLRLSKSQEISRKFSLTTNIFKKFLQSVRPDRDKQLRERPGWGAPMPSEGDLFKRPKKAAPKSAKGSFYRPFWAAGTRRGKGPERPGLEKAPQEAPGDYWEQQHTSVSGDYWDRQTADGHSHRTQPMFDQNTAVWV